ncbi:MAG: radical SAM protein [Ignavibacteria bacterium]|nr:radical SAM protein [Ignavibacteria bacterium]MBI3766857.1 radical SAM protein [Ignavibacteriales bacterium]
MRKLRVGIIDLVTKAPTRALFARVMNANFASIMPQVIAVWCEEEGHDVTLVCYTGFENLVEELPDNVDLVFIGAFSEAAQLAYALSNQFQTNGAVTVLGGPHARCYPQDAQKYFDYVLGFTNKAIICDVLKDCSQHRPIGTRLDAGQQPASLPGVRERWKFIEPTLRKAPFIKMVPMLGSLGCPYTCSFCIDAAVPYQPLDFGVLKEDLRFLLRTIKRPLVGWHDPNFGVRFDDYMDAIEEAVPPDGIDFIAESSLSLLGEPNLKRLKRNGFKAMLPGIESWYELGNKSKTGTKQGMEKVRQVSDHINMIMRYIPYVQANFVLGLDDDKGAEPFELTKRFVDMSPGVFPGYSLLSAFGQAAALNLQYQRDSRVIPFPFHFLDNNQAMNVKPKNYSWPEFYDHVIDLTKHTFSWGAIINRYRATRTRIPKWMNVVRAISSEGFGRIKYHTEIRRRLDADVPFRRFFEQETTEIPQFYVSWIRQQLGPWREWLPEGAMHHDPNAYLKAEQQQVVIPMNGGAKQTAQVPMVTLNRV